MKVYIVMKDWEYDGSEIMSVWADEGAATAEVLAFTKEWLGRSWPRFSVQPWEVKS